VTDNSVIAGSYAYDLENIALFAATEFGNVTNLPDLVAACNDYVGYAWYDNLREVTNVRVQHENKVFSTDDCIDELEDYLVSKFDVVRVMKGDVVVVADFSSGDPLHIPTPLLVLGEDTTSVWDSLWDTSIWVNTELLKESTPAIAAYVTEVLFVACEDYDSNSPEAQEEEFLEGVTHALISAGTQSDGVAYSLDQILKKHCWGVSGDKMEWLISKAPGRIATVSMVHLHDRVPDKGVMEQVTDMLEIVAKGGKPDADTAHTLVKLLATK
jgi:hypothetical protein